MSFAPMHAAEHTEQINAALSQNAS